jgi:TadE-like protein
VFSALTHLSRCFRAERGVAIVEFALVAPLLLLALFGMLEFGKAFNYWNDQQQMANEGARWAAVVANPGGGSVNLQQYIRNQADTEELRTSSHVCISFPTNLDKTPSTQGLAGDPVRVIVTSDVAIPVVSAISNSFFKGSLPSTVTHQVTSTMRLEAPSDLSKYSAGTGGTGGPSCT